MADLNKIIDELSKLTVVEAADKNRNADEFSCIKYNCLLLQF